MSNRSALDPEDFRKNPPENCFAYENLKYNISKLCLEYRKLRHDDEIGKLDGMYVDGDIEKKPGDFVSDTLRGGIIGTMATFEAFIGDLLDEAAKIILFKRKACRIPNCKCPNLEHTLNDSAGYNKWISEEKSMKSGVQTRVNNQERSADVRFHGWDETYTKTLLPKEHFGGITFTDYMLKQQPFIYRYIIDDNKTAEFKLSRPRTAQTPHEQRRQLRDKQRKNEDGPDSIYIKEQDESALCIILRLFYGIRCIMAHGNHHQTLEKPRGALVNFPSCDNCKGNQTMYCAEAVLDLAAHYNEYINTLSHEEKSEAEKLVKRFPKKTEFEEFKTKHVDSSNDDKKEEVKENWDDALYILDSFFHSDTTIEPLPAPYALYHMCRVYFWLRETKREMYITYRQLVRINQFIHMLAFRIHLAVAGILIEHYGFVNGIWSVKTADEIKGKIKNFEEQHRKSVKTVQKGHTATGQDVQGAKHEQDTCTTAITTGQNGNRDILTGHDTTNQDNDTSKKRAKASQEDAATEQK